MSAALGPSEGSGTAAGGDETPHGETANDALKADRGGIDGSNSSPRIGYVHMYSYVRSVGKCCSFIMFETLKSPSSMCMRRWVGMEPRHKHVCVFAPTTLCTFI